MDYLISLYFDKKTNYRINALQEKIGQENKENNNVVLPHITIASIEINNEDKVENIVTILETLISNMTIQKGIIEWVSIGTFPNNTIFIAPVLNEYLQNMSKDLHSALQQYVKRGRNYYKPFQFVPHCSLARRLSDEQLAEAFRSVNQQFSRFEGKIVKIGIAKTKPYDSIKELDLLDKRKRKV